MFKINVFLSIIILQWNLQPHNEVKQTGIHNDFTMNVHNLVSANGVSEVPRTIPN